MLQANSAAMEVVPFFIPAFYSGSKVPVGRRKAGPTLQCPIARSACGLPTRTHSCCEVSCKHEQAWRRGCSLQLTGNFLPCGLCGQFAGDALDSCLAILQVRHGIDTGFHFSSGSHSIHALALPAEKLFTLRPGC